MNTTPTAIASGARAARLTPDGDVQLVATLALTLLTSVTVIGMIRVFADWDFVRPLLLVAVGTHVIAAVARFARVPGWIAVPITLFAAFELICLVYYRDTLAGPFPSARTIDLLRIDFRLVWQQFPSAIAPVPSESSFAPATAIVVGLLAAISDTFAFRAFGRAEAVVPAGVLFIFTAALGVDRHRVTMAALWVAAALLTIALVRFGHGRDQSSWMGSRRFTMTAALPVMLMSVGVTGLAAAAIAPRLPGAGEKALLDTRNREGSVTEVLNPLVDIRAQLVRRGNVELFSVNSNSRHYWRMIALPVFDGETWGPIDEDLDPVGNRASEVGAANRVTVEQRITIKRLSGHLVPAAYLPAMISPDQILWAGDSQSLVLPDDVLEPGDRIDVVSVIGKPSIDELRTASTSGAPGSLYYQLSSGFPQRVRSIAAQVTADASTAYDKAIALQNWFRNNFKYDLDVQLGNSNDAMEVFLRDRRGFCQQFAATFAAMARSLSIPSRVAVGFTPGDFGADGAYHVYGRHAHAWPEVWFEGVGWVAFEPTPSRGAPDGQAHTGVDEEQDNSGGSPGGGGAQPPVSTTPSRPITEPGLTTVPGAGRPTTSTTEPVFVATRGSSGGNLVPVVIAGIALLATLWAVYMPRVLSRIARRRIGTTADRVIAAWRQVCGSLSLAGAPPVGGATPLEYATAAELTTGVDHRALREVALQVTRAIYSSTGVDEAAAHRCELLRSEIDAMCSDRMPLLTRIASRFDPRVAHRRLVG